MTDAQLPEPMSDGEVGWGILATGESPARSPATC